MNNSNHFPIVPPQINPHLLPQINTFNPFFHNPYVNPYVNPYINSQYNQYPVINNNEMNYIKRENEILHKNNETMHKHFESIMEFNKILLNKVNDIESKLILLENTIKGKPINKKNNDKDKNNDNDKNNDKDNDDWISINDIINKDKNNKKKNKKHNDICECDSPMFKSIQKNKKEPLSKMLENIMGDNEQSVVIQLDTGNPFSGSNIPGMFDPFKLLNTVMDSIKNKSKRDTNKETNIEEIEEDNISECGSDVEIEDLGIEIKSIDDLIELGTLFDKIKLEKNNNAELKKEDRDKISSILSKNGLSTDKINTMLNNNEIMIIKKYENKIQDDKDNKVDEKIKNGLYTLNGKKYSLNLEILSKLNKPLQKLKNIIGMEKVKNGIFDMILYYLQNFETKNRNMLHTVIEGPPGVGKTMIGRIIGEIYAALGVIPSNKFKLVKRTDLIGEYVGHTAPKTQKVIDEADGGVLFIDEAYALGSDEKKDSFSKECIDTINQNLSENKNKLICIIAGYPNELENCFFSYNPGLKRRFPFRYTIDGYDSKQLCEIFIKMITDIKWKLNVKMTENEFKKICKENSEYIKNINIKKSPEKTMEIVKKIFNIKTTYDDGKILKYITENNDKLYFPPETNINEIIKNTLNVINNDKCILLSLYYKEHIEQFFEKNKNEFKNYGGDLENLLVMCKFCHSRRIAGKHPKLKRNLTLEDIENGFNKFTSNKKKEDETWKGLYN